MFAAIGALLKRSPAEAGIERGGRCREEIQPGLAKPSRGVLDGAHQRGGYTLAALPRRHEHAGEPRIAWIALEIIENERGSADDGVGDIERHERDRYPVDVHVPAKPDLASLKRLAGIEMAPLGKAPGRGLVGQIGTFSERDDPQRY
jgi:hypothetical protein